MAKNDSSFSFSIHPVGWILVAILLFSAVHISCKREDDAPKEKRIVVPQVKGDEAQIITRFIGSDGLDRNTVIIRSGDWEYVGLGDAVFCRKGDKLVGIYNVKAGVWMTSTNN